VKVLVALCVGVTFAKSVKPAIRHCLGWGKGARDPAAVGDQALQAHGAVFAEVKVDPATIRRDLTSAVPKGFGRRPFAGARSSTRGRRPKAS